METTGNTKSVSVPIWEQYTLTVEEAAKYFRIGENKIRNLIRQNERANYILWDGSHARIKRKLFEQFIDGTSAI